MEFDEHDEQEEEVGIQLTPRSFDAVGNSGRRKSGGGGGGGGYRYKECLKNHAVGIGGQAVDGCGEFMAAGDEGTLDALKCAACNCHRNFHRKEVEGQQRQHQHQQQAALQHQYITATPYYHHHHRPTGYLHMKPPPSSLHQRPLALPSTSRDDLDEISNPSSSGGGGGGVGGSGSKKRFRTKFTQDQKDRMLAFSEALGWRIQKHDEAAVQQFCNETGVKRHVLKVWMHNNKHTIEREMRGVMTIPEEESGRRVRHASITSVISSILALASLTRSHSLFSTRKKSTLISPQSRH